MTTAAAGGSVNTIGTWRSDTEPMDKIVDFINVNRDRYVERAEGSTWPSPASARCPSTPPTCAAAPNGPPTRCAASACRTSASMETPGHPVVYGEWLGAPGAPTILFYGHYDVQPVDPLDLWTSPPFEATVRDGELYARGAADDKGQVFMHFKAVEAHLKADGRAAGQHEVPASRARKRSAAPTSTTSSRPTRTSSPPTSSSSATRRCSTAAFRRSATACAGWRTSRSTCAARSPTCTPARSAARSPIRRWCWRRSSRR